MRRPKGEPEASWEPIGAVRPDPRNARRHPPDQVRRIAASLARFGWGRPLLARLDGTLLAGHGTLLAARWLESDGSDDEDQALAQRYREVSGPAGHVLVRRLDLTPQQARELGLLDNALPSFGEDLDAMIEGVLASSDAEFRGILAAIDDPADALSLEDEWVEDYQAEPDEVFRGRFTIVVRGPIASEPSVLSELRAKLLETEGVEVEITWA